MTYTEKVRVRSCGIVCKDNHVLMVHLNAPTQETPFWTVPGGGVQFGESAKEAVEREILEETGVVAKTEYLVEVAEFVRPPFHAIELFWKMNFQSGEVKLGSDPELGNRQIILSAEWIEISRLGELAIMPEFLPELIVSLEAKSAISWKSTL